MAGKISDMTALGAAPATNDLLEIDDVSAGATRSITVANLFTSPALTTPALGTPSSGNLSNCTALPVGSVTGLGTGVATALAVNVGSAGAPVVLNGAGGTPSSMTGTNITGIPFSTGLTTPYQFGGADAAAPTAVTVSFQGARAGTDTNTAAVNSTFQTSLGTGTGTTGKHIFTVGVKAGSGTGTHTTATALTLAYDSTNTSAQTLLGSGISASAPVLSFAADPDTGIGTRAAGLNLLGFYAGGVQQFEMDTAGIAFVSTKTISWSSGAIGSASDIGVSRVAAKVLGIGTGGAASVAGWHQWAGQSRVAADVTNNTATMANITGLSATLQAGRFYTGKLICYCVDSVAAEGIKFDFDGGNATMTAFRAHGTLFDTALLLSTQTSAIATDFAAATVTGDAMLEIHFSFTCNGAGTFIPRFAQNSHAAGTATVYRESHMVIFDSP